MAQHENPDSPNTDSVSIEEAAAEGPLPGVGAADAAEEAGRENSSTADPDAAAQDAADGDIVGGINMH